MKNVIWVFLFVLALASVALAQTNTSGTIQCDKADPLYTIPVGDHPDHSLVLEQYKCNWTKPMEIAAVATKDGSSRDTGEMTGNTIHFSGFHTTNMDNGDQVFIGYRGTGTSKDNKPVSSKGTWWYTGGTGKFEGIKGKGTFDGTPTAEGGMTFEVKGRYTLSPTK